MAVIDLTKGDFGSVAENVAHMKLSNMYVVDNPLSLTGGSYVTRPTLTTFSTLTERVRGIWFQASAGKTDIYVVAGVTLYGLNSDGTYTALGSVPGGDLCTFASSIFHIAICSAGGIYLWDGTILTAVAIPDGQLVTDVTSLDNYFLLGITNSSKFYWIQPGEVTVDPLDFVSAERNPDDIVSMAAVGDELWALGQNSAEVFQDTGDPDAPFTRIAGRAYSVGCVSKTSVALTIKDTLPCLIWVTPSKEVILAQGAPQKISDESVEEVLKTATSYVGWTFRTNKHDFYVLSTDVSTLVYDLTTGSWSRWFTYQKDTWDGVSGIQVNDVTYSIKTSDGVIFKLSDNNVDNASDYLICEITGFIPNPSLKPISCNRITLFLNYGATSSYTTLPVIEMSFSDDGGHEWTAYTQGTIGTKGNYTTNVSYRSLGQITQPGRYIQLRFSEIQNFRLDGATYND